MTKLYLRSRRGTHVAGLHGSHVVGVHLGGALVVGLAVVLKIEFSFKILDTIEEVL